eukprot:TRINITY_DN15827_c0_g2_i1.p1 TRINITY_DN15827_c0_g2~~TRINITY_DN15827_c0_g2_i1.p1  ORF type:complete len:502 (+),score=87.29 TRINITY_DN15827_c0_g2_i1:74-1579(+)
MDSAPGLPSVVFLWNDRGGASLDATAAASAPVWADSGVPGELVLTEHSEPRAPSPEMTEDCGTSAAGASAASPLARACGPPDTPPPAPASRRRPRAPADFRSGGRRSPSAARWHTLLRQPRSERGAAVFASAAARCTPSAGRSGGDTPSVGRCALLDRLCSRQCDRERFRLLESDTSGNVTAAAWLRWLERLGGGADNMLRWVEAELRRIDFEHTPPRVIAAKPAARRPREGVPGVRCAASPSPAPSFTIASAAARAARDADAAPPPRGGTPPTLPFARRSTTASEPREPLRSPDALSALRQPLADGSQEEGARGHRATVDSGGRRRARSSERRGDDLQDALTAAERERDAARQLAEGEQRRAAALEEEIRRLHSRLASGSAGAPAATEHAEGAVAAAEAERDAANARLRAEQERLLDCVRVLAAENRALAAAVAAAGAEQDHTAAYRVPEVGMPSEAVAADRSASADLAPWAGLGSCTRPEPASSPRSGAPLDPAVYDML